MYKCSIVQIRVPGVGWAQNDRLTFYIGINRETSIQIPSLLNHLVIKTETCIKVSSDILDRIFFSSNRDPEARVGPQRVFFLGGGAVHDI